MYLYAHLRDDAGYLEEMHDEVGDYLHIDILESLQGFSIPGFKVSDLSTHGDLYESIANAFELGLHIIDILTALATRLLKQGRTVIPC